MATVCVCVANGDVKWICHVDMVCVGDYLCPAHASCIPSSGYKTELATQKFSVDHPFQNLKHVLELRDYLQLQPSGSLS